MTPSDKPPGFTVIPTTADKGDPGMIKELQELLAAAKDGSLVGISFVASRQEPDGTVATITGGLGTWNAKESVWAAHRWLYRINKMHDGPLFGQDFPV